MPDISNSILFLEDDFSGENIVLEFDRNLQSLIHQANFEKVKGIIIGRFQEASKMNFDKLKYIIETKEELKNIPIIANLHFGHTNPLISFQIGGTANLKVDDKVKLFILKH